MLIVEKTEYPALKKLGSQIGYGITIGLNLVLIYVVLNIEGWNLLPFLTEQFGEVVPWIALSLLVGALAYLVYILYENQMLRLAGEIVTNSITIVVTWKVFTVFPFDFSAYEFPWAVLVRFMMIVVVIGAAVGAAVNIVKIINSGRTVEKGDMDAHGI